MAVTGPALDDESDEAEFDDEFGGDEPSELPWHNSTRAVVGASAAGIAVIGVLVAAVVFMTGGQGSQSPADFVDPSFSETAAASSATTTTPTITSTPKVSTTEINGPPPPPTTSGSSDTSTSGSETAAAPRRSPGRRARARPTRALTARRRGGRASTSPGHWVPARSAERLLSDPVAGYGPDDPNYYSDSEPTAYAANYGDSGGYQQPPGQPPEEPTPWYRKPAALIGFGALIALLVALIVWLAVSLMSDDSSGSTESTTSTTTTSESASEVAPTQTVTETTPPPSTSTETTAPSTETTTTTTEPSISTSISTSTSTVTVSPPPSNPQVPQIPQIPQIPMPGG